MGKEMDELCEQLNEFVKLAKSEIEKINKKADLTPAEVESVYKIACIADKINCMNSGEYEGSYGYGRHGDGMSGRRYDIRMDSYGNEYGMDGYSERRGRSPVTGRYISRGMDGISGHSIEDRMIAALEDQMDEAKTEYEKQQILEEIKHIRMGTR